MLIGALGFLVFLAYLLAKSVKAVMAEPPMLPEPRFTLVDDLTLVCEDRATRLADELLELGYVSEGTWSAQFTEQSARGQRQSFVQSFLSPDHRTEAQVILVRCLSGSGDAAVGISNGVCTVRSFAEDGRIFMTSNSRRARLFPRNPRLGGASVRCRSVRELVSAHERRVAATDARLRELLPAQALERELEITRITRDGWLERKLIERDGDSYRKTAWLGLRGYVVYALHPVGHEKDVRRALAVFVLLVALSCAAALGIGTIQDSLERVAGATALFALIGIVTPLALRHSILTWGHVALVTAIVCHAVGVTSGVPWIALVLAGAQTSSNVLKGNRRREENLFAAAAARPSSG